MWSEMHFRKLSGQHCAPWIGNERWSWLVVAGNIKSDSEGLVEGEGEAGGEMTGRVAILLMRWLQSTALDSIGDMS